MYVNPNTNIHILKNVPLDNTYRNTIYFSTAAQQASYFASLSKFSLTEYTYQRIDKTINVGINAESLYDCNYIMFQNASFGNKWFYAFITGVEYKGNNCSTITYEMDVMQTWFFDYKVNPCFIEREHILVDTIGANLVEENLEIGEYIYDTAVVKSDGIINTDTIASALLCVIRLLIYTDTAGNVSNTCNQQPEYIPPYPPVLVVTLPCASAVAATTTT